MLPADEALGSPDDQVTQVHDRLVVKDDLIMEQGAPEVRQDGQPLGRVDVQLRAVEGGPNLTGLGRVHGQIGPA